MRIRATRHYAKEWTAIDDDTYDGAEDARSPIGTGSTREEAVADLLEQFHQLRLADPR